MTLPSCLRALLPMLLLAFALAGCTASRQAERGGLGPRGTALPPPDPATGAARTSLPGH